MLSEIAPASPQVALGFTPDWYTLGIVDDAAVATYAASLARSGENNPQHFRWRAFKSFLEKSNALPEHLSAALYHLGDADEDLTLGTNMMTEVLKRRDCPDKLLHQATSCPRRHIAKFAANRLGQW